MSRPTATSNPAPMTTALRLSTPRAPVKESALRAHRMIVALLANAWMTKPSMTLTRLIAAAAKSARAATRLALIAWQCESVR